MIGPCLLLPGAPVAHLYELPPETTMHIPAGDDFEIPVYIQAAPMPALKWRKDAELLQPRGRVM